MRISFLQPVASLQCHCGIKNDEFRHEHIGQLNAYVSYYAENEMQPGDNPPVGICFVHTKERRWWNTPLAVWIIIFCFDIPVTVAKPSAIRTVLDGRMSGTVLGSVKIDRKHRNACNNHGIIAGVLLLSITEADFLFRHPLFSTSFIISFTSIPTFTKFR